MPLSDSNPDFCKVKNMYPKSLELKTTLISNNSVDKQNLFIFIHKLPFVQFTMKKLQAQVAETCAIEGIGTNLLILSLSHLFWWKVFV